MLNVAQQRTKAPTAEQLRPDLLRIANWIPAGSRVLDLGCGDGSLLHYLCENAQTRGWGIELSDPKLVNCLNRGVNAIQADLDDPQVLAQFDDNQFDVVVMSLALQAVNRPQEMLAELLRIGKQGIVTFPNFGHWRCRWQIANGQMPVTSSLPDRWYNTDNIHLCTVRDFERLCGEENILIEERATMDRHHKSSWHARTWPNLFGEIAQYRLQAG